MKKLEDFNVSFKVFDNISEVNHTQLIPSNDNMSIYVNENIDAFNKSSYPVMLMCLLKSYNSGSNNFKDYININPSLIMYTWEISLNKEIWVKNNEGSTDVNITDVNRKIVKNSSPFLLIENFNRYDGTSISCKVHTKLYPIIRILDLEASLELTVLCKNFI
ncbi:unnamed protein product [Gordionus sp. m RMFG-2023]